jgi:hypothetical protein
MIPFFSFPANYLLPNPAEPEPKRKRRVSRKDAKTLRVQAFGGKRVVRISGLGLSSFGRAALGRELGPNGKEAKSQRNNPWRLRVLGVGFFFLSPHLGDLAAWREILLSAPRRIVSSLATIASPREYYPPLRPEAR